MGRYFGKVCEKHPELSGARLESSGKCVRCHGDRVLAFKKRPEQRAKIRERQRGYELKGGDQYANKLIRNSRWYRNNRDWFKARNLLRKGLGGDWPQYRDDMKAFYQNRPEGFHVDHIVPLKGIDRITKQHVVCGLHVPWNLQYLPGGENEAKWAWFEGPA